MGELRSCTVVAFNTATASKNRMHDDAVAQHVLHLADEHPAALTIHTAIYRPRGPR